MHQKISVLKFGGSSLETPDLIKAAAQRVKDIRSLDKKVIVIVSAMGTTTNTLVDLAFKVSDKPSPRELDMLISTGERISISLLSMALHDLGVDAISFTGSQAGILTTPNHNDAEILELKPIRVEEALGQGKVVIIAGFQGVDPSTKEITTLGRGGSDITAMAFAHYFDANECLFLKDVQGVFTSDPNAISSAKHIPTLSHQFLYNLCLWGSKILHPRCVAYALKKQINFTIGHCINTQLPLTQVSLEAPDKPLAALTGFEDIFCVQLNTDVDSWVKGLPTEKQITLKKNIIYSDDSLVYIKTNDEPSEPFKNHFLSGPQVVKSTPLSTVSLVMNSENPEFIKGLQEKVTLKFNSFFSTPLAAHWVVEKDLQSLFIKELQKALL